MSIEHRIDQTHEALAGMDSADTVRQWADRYPGEVLRYTAAYNNLLRRTNNLLVSDSISEESMPYLYKLQKTLKGNELPLIGDFTSEDFLSGLDSAAGPVLMGQSIKRKTIPDTQLNKQQAILTTSNDLAPNVLTAALIAHLIERTAFENLNESDFEPEGGWTKDDILKAFDEVLLLDRYQNPNKEHTLWKLFRTPAEEGGFGWISDEMESEFRERIANY